MNVSEMGEATQVAHFFRDRDFTGVTSETLVSKTAAAIHFLVSNKFIRSVLLCCEPLFNHET